MMKVNNLDNFIRGWFVGNFEPTLYKTNDVEVAVQYYKKGTNEKSHIHKIASEITVVISGKVKINTVIFKEKDIIFIEPNEISSFEAIEDTTTLVVKIPGAKNDKYEI